MKKLLHQSIDFSACAAQRRRVIADFFFREFSAFHDCSPSNFFADHENSIKVDSRDDVGVDVDNDDDLPMMGDIDSGDHDSNDMSRPRKIRR